MSSSGYPTASDGAVGGGGFRERADRGRAVEGYSVLVLSAIALAIGVSRFAASKAPLGTMFVVGAVSAALYGAGRISMSRRVQRSADYWRQEPGFIQFGPSRGLGLGDYLPAIVASAGALAAMWMQLASGAADINGAWTLTLAVFVLLGSVLTLVTVPTGGRGAPEIILTPEAAWIWTGGRKRTCIPWTAQPNLETSIVHRLRPHVMITGGTGGPALLPIFVLPIGHVQFQAVLGFYAAHADLRGELASDQGLQRVRALMSTPAPAAERTASDVAATQGAARPAATPSYPVSPYAGVAYQDSPYGGSPYVMAPPGAARPRSAVPETMELLASATSGAAPAPVPVGSGAAPAYPQTAASHDLAEDGRQDEGRTSSEPQSCQEADRKVRRAPWRILIWAVIVLVGSAYGTSSQQVGAFLLGAVVFLVLLIHAVALAGARRCRTVAGRRWTWSPEGIRLRSTWFVPLALRVEAALMALGSLASMGLLAVGDRTDRAGIVLSLLIAMVLLVTAGFLGLTAPRPRRSTEIILDPERIRTAAGTSRESPFWWMDRPRVVGIDSGGTVLIEIEPAGRVRARLGTLPLTYVQLQRIIDFYSSHPELRDELADERGLERVRELMGARAESQ